VKNKLTTTLLFLTSLPLCGGVTDGGFENGYTGWSRSGNQNTYTAGTYIVSEGTHAVQFNGANTTPNGVLSQSIATTPGTLYTAKFDMGVYSYQTSAEMRLNFTVTGSGTLLNNTLSIFGGGGSGKYNAFQKDRTFSFTANSTSTTLTFRDVSPNTTNIDLLLDNVRVSAGTSSTPHHAYIVILENHGYNQVIGNSQMPYYNALVSQYASGDNYYANTHPSIGNYFVLTTGQIITNDDTFGGTVWADNIVRRLIAAGKTWKEYSESIPYIGYTGGNVGPYVQHHNPCSYFSDVRGTSQQNRLVSTGQLANDIASNSLPTFGFIVPDDNHNGHTGDLAAADAWLQSNIDPLIRRLGTNDFVIFTWDEAQTSDTRNGGGHISWVVVGPRVKRGYRSQTFYQHQNTLRWLCDLMGTATPSSAASCTSMVGQWVQ